jgi:hypothetical protein
MIPPVPELGAVYGAREASGLMSEAMPGGNMDRRRWPGRLRSNLGPQGASSGVSPERDHRARMIGMAKEARAQQKSLRTMPEAEGER